MESVGTLLKQRIEQIIVENEMLRAGFAALPYMVLRDVGLTMGARLVYAVLLMYAWQEGSCFPGQKRMSEDVGISQRNLRRFLAELRDEGYISWRKHMPGGTNTYFIHDVKTKLKAKAKRPRAASQRGRGRPLNGDGAVRQIDSAIRPREIDPVIRAG